MEPRKLFGSLWFALGTVSVLMLTIVHANAPDISEKNPEIPPRNSVESKKDDSADGASNKESESGDDKDSESAEEAAGKPDAASGKLDIEDESGGGDAESKEDDSADGASNDGASNKESKTEDDTDPASADEASGKLDIEDESGGGAGSKNDNSDSSTDYKQVIPSSAVFGCDAPSASLRDGHGGTYNNALIVTYSYLDPDSVYGKHQGDLAIFTEAEGESGMFRCGEVAKKLNRFTQNPDQYQNFVFNIDNSPKPMICYTPAGTPCEDEKAEVVMYLKNGRISTIEALKRLTLNLNLIRSDINSRPIWD